MIVCVVVDHTKGPWFGLETRGRAPLRGLRIPLKGPFKGALGWMQGRCRVDMVMYGFTGLLQGDLGFR